MKVVFQLVCCFVLALIGTTQQCTAISTHDSGSQRAMVAEDPPAAPAPPALVFSPDTNASYYSCPSCDTQEVPANDITTLELQSVSEVIGRFVGGLHTNSVDTVMKQFCTNATLWGTVSQAFRFGTAEVTSYFDYFANEPNQVDGSCIKVVTLDPATKLFTAHTAVQANGGCLRMSFTIQLSENNSCIADLYSSQFPNDPELLVFNDTLNNMPWTPYTDDKRLPAPATALGSCSDCAEETNAGVEPADLTEMKEVLGNWATGLLGNDPQMITDTYCKSSPMLWGTVSNMRRFDTSQVQSYFDWFATSRNFTDPGPGIRRICSRYSKMQYGEVWRDDRDVDLGGQCLRMSYFLVKENGKMCIKTLSSSYFPEVPSKLAQADYANGMPWATTPPPTPSAAKQNQIELPLLASVIVGLVSFLF